MTMLMLHLVSYLRYNGYFLNHNEFNILYLCKLHFNVRFQCSILDKLSVVQANFDQKPLGAVCQSVATYVVHKP